jgi:hypothetical protein
MRRTLEEFCLQEEPDEHGQGLEATKQEKERKENIGSIRVNIFHVHQVPGTDLRQSSFHLNSKINT